MLATLLTRVLLAVPIACKSTPPELPPPAPLALPSALRSETDHYRGSLLGGATAVQGSAPADPADPGEALQLRCSIIALERLPATGLSPLATRTRLVAAPEEGDPLLSSTALTPGAALARADEARTLLDRIAAGAFGRSLVAGELATALPPETTATISLAATETVEDPDNYLGEYKDLGPTQRLLGVHVSRTPSGPEVALVLEGLAPPPERDDAEELPRSERSEYLRPGAAVPRRELIVPVDTPEVGEGPYALLVRSPFDTGEARAFVVALEIESPRAWDAGSADGARRLAEHADALTRALEDVRVSARRAEELSQPLAPDDAQTRALRRAYDALEATRQTRSTLVYLTTRTGAELAGDVALVADKDLLDTLEQWLEAGREELAEPVEQDALAWQIERTAYQLLSTRAMEGSLPAELEAVWLYHAGEVGRYPSVVQDLLGASRDLDSFRRQLTDENLFFLEDSNPASRVRAFDWLAARGAAPEGFAPLADAAERRAVLTRAAEAALLESESAADAGAGTDTGASTSERQP